uniref:Alpha-L-arabinofuranosidase 1 catalytic domain-containing protein n=2 Tax=Aegilops tauschii subsp. strangulata TaxID=200361 RepID=A0A453GUV1_AEGTS
MPSDTHKGHGFRKELISMLLDLRPRFLRFPGGCFVEGEWLINAFRWKEIIGPWEQRPGHFGDVWHYWTDDGLGYYEFLQLAEDLDATPIWVVNIGISHHDKINISDIAPLVEVSFQCPRSLYGSTIHAISDKYSSLNALQAKFSVSIIPH